VTRNRKCASADKKSAMASPLESTVEVHLFFPSQKKVLMSRRSRFTGPPNEVGRPSTRLQSAVPVKLWRMNSRRRRISEHQLIAYTNLLDCRSEGELKRQYAGTSLGSEHRGRDPTVAELILPSYS